MGFLFLGCLLIRLSQKFSAVSTERMVNGGSDASAKLAAGFVGEPAAFTGFCVFLGTAEPEFSAERDQLEDGISASNADKGEGGDIAVFRFHAAIIADVFPGVNSESWLTSGFVSR
jgi:hypothetical protein